MAHAQTGNALHFNNRQLRRGQNDNVKLVTISGQTGAQGGVGTPEWCETYIPWSEGLTFNMITWQRQCDVTNDGVYDMCDYYEPTGISSFEELEWQDRCNNGMPWDGS